MKMKRFAIIALAALVIVCGTFAANTVRANAMTYDEAVKIAAEQVPASAELVKSEKDWSKYEFKYRDDASSSDYEVEVSKKKKMVTEVSMEFDGEAGGKEATLDEKKATAVAQDLFPEATIENIRLDQDDNGYTYAIEFSGNGYYGDIDINAETGVVNEYELHYGTATVIPMDDEKESADKNVDDKSDVAAVPDAVITEDEAKEIVLAKIPGATIDRIELEMEDGIPEYEIVAHLDDTRYEIDVHAVTGVISDMETESLATGEDLDEYDDDMDEADDDWDDEDDDDQYDTDDDWDDDDQYEADDDDRYDDDDDDDRYDDDDDDEEEDDDDDDDERDD